MLSTSDFNPVSLQDKDFFKQHYERFPQVHSDNTFTNMVCWNPYANYKFAYMQECVVLSSTIEKTTRYRPPIGLRDPHLLADLLELASKSEDSYPLVILDSETKDWILQLYPHLKLDAERKYFDYVYLANNLAELPGKKYLTIRHQLNKFQRTCSPLIETVSKENIGEIREFLDQWCNWKDCDSDPILSSEKEAILFAISHYQELELSGLAIRANGKIGAVSLFEGLNKDTALVHFEKGLPDCKGIYRAINAETAKILAKEYVFINRESDMGVEGIREAKMRYHPHHMVEVHLVKRDELERIV
jgi:hypothetical protein